MREARERVKVKFERTGGEGEGGVACVAANRESARDEKSMEKRGTVRRRTGAKILQSEEPGAGATRAGRGHGKA